MVTYRLANENDYENINQFHNRIYKKNRTMNQFLWEFHNGPFGKSIYVIATDGPKVVGTNCVIPIMLSNAKNEMILTGKSEDTLVDPEYRGQNIFNHIYDHLFKHCADKGIKSIWGYTPAKKPFQKIGFDIPFDHQQSLIVNSVITSYNYINRLNPNNGFKQKMQIFGLCVFSKLKSFMGSFAHQKSIYDVKSDQKAINEVNNLVKASAGKNAELFYILQNEAFQLWRIYDNPNYHKVHTFSAYDNNKKLVGLILLNTHPNGVAYIIQSSFDASVSDKEKINILNFTVKSLFKEGIKLIRNWHFETNLLNKEEIKLFKNANFIVLKKGIGFVWKEIHPTNLNPNNFVLSRISTQGII